jgi:hypothetical protein
MKTFTCTNSTLIDQPDMAPPLMIPTRTLLIPVMLICILCTAGCMTPPAIDNQTMGNSTDSVPTSIAKYKVTLAQPEDSAKLINMDTDVYNIGEVVEFTVMNDKGYELSCSNNPPSFTVTFQKGNGKWVTRMGAENPVPGNTSSLRAGESTQTYRFVTIGWDPGRYRINSDCGVSREILIRTLPSLKPAVTACPTSAGNTSPWIRVNPLSDQYAGEEFMVSGTTSMAAGEELVYSIFAIGSTGGNLTAAKMASSSIIVTEGSCGTNTWSVDGQIQVPGGYFFGISNGANTVSAIKRFTVLPAVLPAKVTALPANATAPGISTG